MVKNMTAEARYKADPLYGEKAHAKAMLPNLDEELITTQEKVALAKKQKAATGAMLTEVNQAMQEPMSLKAVLLLQEDRHASRGIEIVASQGGSAVVHKILSRAGVTADKAYFLKEWHFEECKQAFLALVLQWQGKPLNLGTNRPYTLDELKAGHSKFVWA